MDIGYNTSVLSFYSLESSDIQILSDHCDLLYKSIFYGLGCICCPSLCHERIHVSRVVICNLIYNCLNESLELIVLCNEIRLRVNLNDSCNLVISYDSLNNTLCCDSAGFLLSLCLSVLSEELNSCVHIAVCLCKGFLAVHHSCACHFS